MLNKPENAADTVHHQVSQPSVIIQVEHIHALHNTLSWSRSHISLSSDHTGSPEGTQNKFYICFTLCTVHCILYTVSCVLYPVYCILYTVCCIMYPVQCILTHVSSILCTVSCILVLFRKYPVWYVRPGARHWVRLGQADAQNRASKSTKNSEHA